MRQIEWPAATVPDEDLEEAAGVFSLLGSAARLRLLVVLGEGEQDVTALADALGASGPSVSQHLAKLRLAGVVTARRDGKRQLYRVASPWVLDQVRAALRQVAEPAAD